MGVHCHGGTLPGCVTPICNDCGIALCWDISEEDYEAARDFWDAWKCQNCNGTAMSLKAWIEDRRKQSSRALRPSSSLHTGAPHREIA